jgi:hypothetical protein
VQNHNRPDAPVKVSPVAAKADPPPTEPKPPWFVRCSVDFLDARVTPLSDRARYVLEVLDGFARTDPFCFPSNEALAAMTGKTDRAIRDILEELDAAKWTERLFTEAGRPERVGIIMLRRVDPRMPAADTPERRAEAVSALHARKGAPDQAEEICRLRRKKSSGTRRKKSSTELDSRCR